MTAKKNNDVDSQAVTPGAILAVERQKQGKDERFVAEALKISLNRLKSIEADDYNAFLCDTYTRGYLKNYGRLLGVNESLLIEAFEAMHPEPDQQPDSHPEMEVALSLVNSHKQWWFVYVVLVVLVLFWVLSYWLLGGQAETETSQAYPDYNSEINSTTKSDKRLSAQANPEQKELQTATEAQASLTNKTDSSDLEPPIAYTKQDLLVSKVTAAELVKNIINRDQQESAPMEPAITSMVTRGDSLSFSFENQCWIKVTDANNEVIFAGLQQPGTDLSLYGKAPFSITVGNIDGTSLSYNGEPVKLSAKGESNLIRLQIGG